MTDLVKSEEGRDEIEKKRPEDKKQLKKLWQHLTAKMQEGKRNQRDDDDGDQFSLASDDNMSGVENDEIDDTTDESDDTNEIPNVNVSNGEDFRGFLNRLGNQPGQERNVAADFFS